jgi:hypothetical protein
MYTISGFQLDHLMARVHLYCPYAQACLDRVFCIKGERLEQSLLERLLDLEISWQKKLASQRLNNELSDLV